MSVPPPEQVSNAAPMSSRVAVRRWLGVMGTIVVVCSLYLARDVLVPIVFSMSGETSDIGLDSGSPVGPYPHHFACTAGSGVSRSNA